MQPRIALATLALSLALSGAAAAQTTWTGSALTVTGNRENGCDLRVIEVSHAGSALHSLRFMLANRHAHAVRVTADVTMTRQSERKSGTITGLMGPGQQSTLTGFHPLPGSLAGSTVALRFLACTPG